MIMKAYIQKYKLTFLFLFLLISGVVKGQTNIRYQVYEPEYFFACRQATPIDLFKAANMFVSPEYGYWGDINGVPYNGKPYKKKDPTPTDPNPLDSDTIKERRYTNGNIFIPPILESDTGVYNFYFYFTSTKDYCGIKQGTTFQLSLYLGSLGCIMPISGMLDNTHLFCYNSTIDLGPKSTREPISRPVTIENLLLAHSENPLSWKKDRSMNGDWVEIDVYTDREHQNHRGDGDMEIDLLNSYDSTYYVIIHGLDDQEYSDSISIRVFPESSFTITFDPSDIANPLSIKEYDIDDKITIKVDTTGFQFSYYKFLMNNNNLNKYYLGGDSISNEITLSALAFTGVEDFIEVIATDINKCIVRREEKVIVNVPFPTVFTPDGDGINDVFLGGEKFRNREFHLEISNRWGSQLYSGESGWDGTYRGNYVPPGTYLYVLILKTDNGASRTIKGTVTLIRENK
jgi:gliding motility-associated-like protein